MSKEIIKNIFKKLKYWVQNNNRKNIHEHNKESYTLWELNQSLDISTKRIRHICVKSLIARLHKQCEIEKSIDIGLKLITIIRKKLRNCKFLEKINLPRHLLPQKIGGKIYIKKFEYTQIKVYNYIGVYNIFKLGADLH